MKNKNFLDKHFFISKKKYCESSAKYMFSSWLLTQFIASRAVLYQISTPVLCIYILCMYVYICIYLYVYFRSV